MEERKRRRPLVKSLKMVKRKKKKDLKKRKRKKKKNQPSEILLRRLLTNVRRDPPMMKKALVMTMPVTKNTVQRNLKLHPKKVGYIFFYYNIVLFSIKIKNLSWNINIFFTGKPGKKGKKKGKDWGKNKKAPGSTAKKGGGKGKGGGYTRAITLSPELAAIVGAEQMARHEVVKKVWGIIKERNLYVSILFI